MGESGYSFGPETGKLMPENGKKSWILDPPGGCTRAHFPQKAIKPGGPFSCTSVSGQAVPAGGPDLR